MFLFLLLVTFNNFFIIPVVRENTRLKDAVIIPMGSPTRLKKDMILIPPLVGG